MTVESARTRLLLAGLQFLKTGKLLNFELKIKNLSKTSKRFRPRFTTVMHDVCADCSDNTRREECESYYILLA
jgi:hypothetical protein